MRRGASALFVAGAMTLSPPLLACPSWLDQGFERLQTGERESLCRYAGKVLLVVNTASECGYTGQYEGLEALSRELAPKGLVVLGFPSNEFGAQEPGDNEEIARFCRTAYGIQFPMFAKSAVAGPAANPFFAELARRGGGAPRWNFHKYLIDRSGTRVLSFASAVKPDSEVLRREIMTMLDAAAGPDAGGGRP